MNEDIIPSEEDREDWSEATSLYIAYLERVFSVAEDMAMAWVDCEEVENGHDLFYDAVGDVCDAVWPAEGTCLGCGGPLHDDEDEVEEGETEVSEGKVDISRLATFDVSKKRFDA